MTKTEITNFEQLASLVTDYKNERDQLQMQLERREKEVKYLQSELDTLRTEEADQVFHSRLEKHATR